MMTSLERLMSLRAGDLMSRDVVLVTACQSMGEAAALLREHELRSAPVVDDQGHCVGVLSASDFLHPGLIGRDAAAGGTGSSWKHAPAGGQSPEPFHIEETGGERVSRFMTSALHTVDEDTPLLQVARTLCGAHVHHLIVLDEHRRPQGVISSLDLVAAVTAAIDEAKASRAAEGCGAGQGERMS